MKKIEVIFTKRSITSPAFMLEIFRGLESVSEIIDCQTWQAIYTK